MKLNDYSSFVNFTSDPNTTLLYRTSNWKLGASQVKEILMDAKSKITVYVGKKADKYILGIPIKYSDVKFKKLTLE